MATVVELILEEDPETPTAVAVEVEVVIDGHRRRLLVDTGGAQSSLAADALTARLATTAPQPAGGRGVFSESAPARRVTAGSMRIGDLRVDRPGFDVAGAPDAPSLLGLDVLRTHRLAFRFSRAELEIDGDSPVDERRELRRSGRGHPYVDLAADGTTMTAIWDSGAGVSVVDRGVVARHPTLFRAVGRASGTDALGVSAETDMVEMAAVAVGGRRFAPSVAAVADIAGIGRPGDPPFQVILGMPVLRHADWVLDLADGWWGYAR